MIQVADSANFGPIQIEDLLARREVAGARPDAQSDRGAVSFVLLDRPSAATDDVRHG